MTSLAENFLFLLPKVFHSMSSNPLNKRGLRWLWKLLLEVIKQLHFEKSFPEDISFLLFVCFLNKCVFTRHVIFLTGLSYVGNGFTSRRPRCSENFLLKGWGGGGVGSSFSVLYTQAFCQRPVNPPAGRRALSAGHRGTLFCHFRLLTSRAWQNDAHRPITR